MKTFQFMAIFVSFTGIISCSKDNSETIDNINVENYVKLLKLNQYDSLNLPVFTYKDIPALLVYRNETQIITNFPHNPVSSLYRADCKLGIFILWTIESVRAVAINSEHLIMRFPSQNPVLTERNSGKSELEISDETHKIVAKAYFEWWENNKNKDFNEFKNTDPLAETEYTW
jgi:hypothetical protein